MYIGLLALLVAMALSNIVMFAMMARMRALVEYAQTFMHAGYPYCQKGACIRCKADAI